MRTTVDLESDTSAAIEQLRRAEGLDVSQAVNKLIRRGLLNQAPRPPFRQRTRPLGLRVDVSNVFEAVDALDDPVAGRAIQPTTNEI